MFDGYVRRRSPRLVPLLVPGSYVNCMARSCIRRATIGDGLYVTGTVTNTSDQNVSSAHVGAVFLDAKGVPIGFSSTNLVENLSAGKTKGFETLPSACAINRSSVAKVVVLDGSSY